MTLRVNVWKNFKPCAFKSLKGILFDLYDSLWDKIKAEININITHNFILKISKTFKI